MIKRDDPINPLFKLPLTEFISARKELAARLKKNGDTEEAEHVKTLAKPPVSAWTVNQLYWKHRDAFDELMATGQRLRKAQSSGKMANIREALDARREALSQLSELATEVLTDAGHNPSLDTLRRITSTLEALSASTSSDGPTPGRLTHDVDPPGFDSFGSFVPSAAPTTRAPKTQLASSSKRSVTDSAKIRQRQSVDQEEKRRAERQARINAAKATLQSARKAVTAAQAQTKSLEAALKRAEAAAKEAEKQKQQAAERFKKATAAAAEADERVANVAQEISEANDALAEAKRAVEKATRELERSFQE